MTAQWQKWSSLSSNASHTCCPSPCYWTVKWPPWPTMAGEEGRFCLVPSRHSTVTVCIVGCCFECNLWLQNYSHTSFFAFHRDHPTTVFAASVLLRAPFRDTCSISAHTQTVNTNLMQQYLTKEADACGLWNVLLCRVLSQMCSGMCDGNQVNRDSIKNRNRKLFVKPNLTKSAYATNWALLQTHLLILLTLLYLRKDANGVGLANFYSCVFALKHKTNLYKYTKQLIFRANFYFCFFFVITLQFV